MSALSPSSCCRYQREPIPHVKCPLCRIIKQCIMAKNCETQHSHHHPSVRTQGHTCTYTHMHISAHGIPLSFVPTLLSLHSLLLPLHSKTNYFALLYFKIKNQWYYIATLIFSYVNFKFISNKSREQFFML